ncbi:MAG: LptF/LptG family permease [Bdellovibrionales bacterium]
MKLKGLRAHYYVFKEIVPSFFLGLLVFILVLLLFQALRLTEFVLVHGVSQDTIFQIVLALCISFLPAIIPMSALFSVIMTYGRLSADSEFVALKALGLPMRSLMIPGAVFSIILSILCAQTVFYSGPWGNRKFEVIMAKLQQSKASASIQEGTFSDGFYDMILYADKVDSKRGLLEKVFIYDERSPTPLSIIAKRGQMIQSNKIGDTFAVLRLIDGNIHQPKENSYTKIHFERYDINLSRDVDLKISLSPPSLSLPKLLSETRLAEKAMNDPNGRKERTEWFRDRNLKLQIETQKRFAIAMLPIVFGLIGFALGSNPNKRKGGSNGFVLSMIVIVCFWVMYITGENLAKEQKLPVVVGVWYTNFSMLAFAFKKKKKNWD